MICLGFVIWSLWFSPVSENLLTYPRAEITAQKVTPHQYIGRGSSGRTDLRGGKNVMLDI